MECDVPRKSGTVPEVATFFVVIYPIMYRGFDEEGRRPCEQFEPVLSDVLDSERKADTN